VYQFGRGSEPVIVVGSMMSFVARYIAKPPKIQSHQDFPRREASLDFAAHTRLYRQPVKQQNGAAAMP
jgi:hypothetical protein